MKLYRLGKDLILGEAKNSEQNVLHLENQFILGESGWERMDPSICRVSESFIINCDFHLDESKVITEKEQINIGKVVHENFSPFLGRRQVEFGNTRVVAYQRKSGLGIGIVQESNEVTWVPFTDILSQVQIGQYMALESLREKIVGLGLLEDTHRGLVQEGFSELPRDIHVYMRVDPFKDVTTLREGTPVAVLGYYKGNLVVEADGEIFWRPIEETAYWDDPQKGDSYYFSLDSDRDGIPDPLQALPSKPALSNVKPRPEDNYNVQPELKKSSHHFGPNQNFLEFSKDFGVLEGYIGTNGFESDERLNKPGIHDVGYEPGLDAADQDDQVDRDELYKCALTVDDDEETGIDSVDQDFEGEYGEIPPDDGTGSIGEADEPKHDGHTLRKSLTASEVQYLAGKHSGKTVRRGKDLRVTFSGPSAGVNLSLFRDELKRAGEEVSVADVEWKRGNTKQGVINFRIHNE